MIIVIINFLIILNIKKIIVYNKEMKILGIWKKIDNKYKYIFNNRKDLSVFKNLD